jgi:hypothetical protein
MTRSGCFFGGWATSFGVLGLIATIEAEYLRVAHDPRGGAILRFLDRLGLVKNEPHSVAIITSSSVFSINDSTAILWLFAYGVYLAIIAFFFSLLAEYRHEETLYLSAGFILAVAAIAFVNIVASIMISVSGFVTVLSLRQIRASP